MVKFGEVLKKKSVNNYFTLASSDFLKLFRLHGETNSFMNSNVFYPKEFVIQEKQSKPHLVNGNLYYCTPIKIHTRYLSLIPLISSVDKTL